MKYDKAALIDNVFFQKFYELRDFDSELAFKEFFNQSGISPLIHPYIFEFEIIESEKKEFANCLISDGLLGLLDWFDFIKPDEFYSKAYYSGICASYQKLFKKPLIIPAKSTIKDFHISSNSLGEVHSIFTAKILDVPLFCSNDHDSKCWARKLSAVGKRVEVRTISEMLSRLPNFDRQAARALQA